MTYNERRTKIIDIEHKGNVVRLYMGKDGLEDWGGDDWEDIPYEHNAGTVYPDYYDYVIDLMVDFEYDVYEPASDTQNSSYCKDDFKERKAPAIVISKDHYSYATALADDYSLKIYYGDTIDSIRTYPGISVVKGKKV